jgi:hypothetical protein
MTLGQSTPWYYAEHHYWSLLTAAKNLPLDANFRLIIRGELSWRASGSLGRFREGLGHSPDCLLFAVCAFAISVGRSKLFLAGMDQIISRATSKQDLEACPQRASVY